MAESPLAVFRRDALNRARRFLLEQQFVGISDNEYSGVLATTECASIAVKLILGPKFPDILPDVFVKRQSLSRRIPHVEANGKLCIAAGAVLLDVDNPEGIVSETLIRAAQLVDAGLSGRNEKDFLSEFARYWSADSTFASICNSQGGAREICVAIFETDRGRLLPGGCEILVADDRAAVSRWSHNLGFKQKLIRSGFFLPLETAFAPPDFEEEWSIGRALEIIKTHCTSFDHTSFCLGLQFPVFIVLSLPQDNAEDRVLVGLRNLTLPKTFRTKAGTTRSDLAAFKEFEKRSVEKIERIGIVRCDARYLLARGGASNRFLSSTVVIIGCGAVGSVVAEQLLALGIGHLRLIDPDKLNVENVHRHALGMRSVNSKKASALCIELRGRFPHLTVDNRDSDVEEVLSSDPAFVFDADLVVLTTGDPTLELQLNELLQARRIRRIHAWVEPLGLGGHALSAGLTNGPGCFRCIFTQVPDSGLFNGASFVAPGQDFSIMTGGCSGQFTPFSALHAGRIATETTTLAAAVLSGDEKENVLISYRGDSRLFESQYKLSARGSGFRSGEIRRETRHADGGCSTCREQS